MDKSRYLNKTEYTVIRKLQRDAGTGKKIRAAVGSPFYDNDKEKAGFFFFSVYRNNHRSFWICV